MFKVQNMKKLFLAVFLIAAVPALCMADGKRHHRMKHGTIVNVGAHAVLLSFPFETIRLVVQYVNPSNNPITIREIKIFRPDGTLETSPDFFAADLEPPFILGPFQAKSFALIEADIDPEEFILPNMTGVFQVYTKWKSRRPTNGLKSFSVITTTSPLKGDGIESNYSIEGFDIKVKKHKYD